MSSLLSIYQIFVLNITKIWMYITLLLDFFNPFPVYKVATVETHFLVLSGHSTSCKYLPEPTRNTYTLASADILIIIMLLVYLHIISLRLNCTVGQLIKLIFAGSIFCYLFPVYICTYMHVPCICYNNS